MANQHPKEPHQSTQPHHPEGAHNAPPEDLASKHLLDSPKGPTPAPNPESAPDGDKVGGDMTTAPFTGAPLKDQPAKSSHK